ncbi:hypothetical protein SAMN04487989_102421 [Bizionia echini]|uniref:DUF8201 domain-containing protein n=1 Tax=Bizionia echini TaxID=649333 RepID=A0A1I5B151_9FLAO|nr:hypothetical protein [Bizionia echini]SFN68466.1 hypothetical protein SAMN04487989_102421 [Bizionia echini]
MLLILFSWIYIIFTSMVFGISINGVLKTDPYHLIISVLHGLFGIMLFTGFWAVVLPVSVFFHVALLITTCTLLHFNWDNIKSSLQNFFQEVKSLSVFFKSLLVIITLLIIAQCASAPFLVDNETYYIQTIAWLNEYGFVKGLVNLHLFLGQTSGWHILQSAFSFSFLTDALNDLSGLALLLGNIYALTKINSYLKSENTNKWYLFIGLLPIVNFLLFQFISAPSPDLAIYVLSIIVFYLFIILYDFYQKNIFISLILLTSFMVCIKLTALPFLIFPLATYVKYYKQTRFLNIKIFSILGVSACLLVTKNVIITGNPLYPFLGMDSFKTSWHLPKPIVIYFKEYGLAYGYHMEPDFFAETSFLVHMKHWLFASGIHGVTNKTIMILLVILPFIIKKWFHQKAYWVFYITLVLTMVVLWNTSPQYRFFLPFILISGLMILSIINLKKSAIKTIYIVSTILVFITVFLPINKQAFTENTQHQQTSIFKIDYILTPHNNSKFPVEYDAKIIGNTPINTPKNTDFFWETGNTPIPAVSNAQLNYFKEYFFVVPQLRTERLQDGFYSKKNLTK